VVEPRKLIEASVSFKDLVRRYASYVETAGKEIAKKGLPDGLPSELEDQLQDALGHLGDAYLPATTARVKALPEQIATFLVGKYGQSAVRLKKAAETIGLELKDSDLRLVNAGITFDQIVHNPWSWQGTLVEARLPASTIAVTPILPADYFVVYAPAGTPAPKNTPYFKIVKTRTR
jgi:hypothetical protein